MNRITLKRSYFQTFIKILVESTFIANVIANYNDRDFFWWLFLFFAIIIFIGLCFELLYPLMIIKDENVCFFQHKRKLWRWVYLPIHKIEKIEERKRNEQMTFIFIMKDGKEFEFFPRILNSYPKRLNRTISFLNNNISEVVKLSPKTIRK